MKIIPLEEQTRAMTGFSHKVIIAYTDLAAAALTKTLTIFPDTSISSNQLPAGNVLWRCGYQLVTPFAGAGVTSLVVDIGDKASGTRYLANANTDLLTALGTNTKDFVVGTTAFAFPGTFPPATNAQYTALFTAVGANLSVLTAGLVEIYLALVDMARLRLDQEPGPV